MKGISLILFCAFALAATFAEDTTIIIISEVDTTESAAPTEQAATTAEEVVVTEPAVTIIEQAATTTEQAAPTTVQEVATEQAATTAEEVVVTEPAVTIIEQAATTTEQADLTTVQEVITVQAATTTEQAVATEQAATTTQQAVTVTEQVATTVKQEATTEEIETVTEIELNFFGCPVDIEIERYLPHAEYCDHYYVCAFGSPVLRECPVGLVWNIYENACDWPTEVDCGTKTIPERIVESEEEKEDSSEVNYGYDDPSKAEEICAQENSNGFLISNEICNKFYMCADGKPQVFDCPSNLYYNPKIGQCDWQHNVVCTNVVTVQPSEGDDAATIACRSGAFLVPHESYCNWFYMCDTSGPKPVQCQKGTVFHKELQTCNWPYFVNCGEKVIYIKAEEVIVA